MEPEPQMNVSRPSSLRLAGFAISVLGGLLLGIGAVQTWVTVGFEKVTGLDTATRGTDVWQGKAALATALVVLVAVIASRLVRERARAVCAGFVIGAGAVGAAVAGAFALTAPTTYTPLDRPDVIEAVARATGQTADEVRATACEKLTCVTTVGAGPWLALLGGAVAFIGGILVLAWATRVSPGATEPAEGDPSTGPETT